MLKLFGVLAASLALAGCGGSSGPTDEQQAHSVVDQFTVAMGQDNLSAACPLTTGQMKATCDALKAAGGAAPSAFCSQVGAGSVLGQQCALEKANAAALAAYTGVTVSKLVITGSSATVIFAGRSEVMALQKLNGHWLVSSG